MVQLKINISDKKSGKSIQKELTEEQSIVFLGKKIGEKISGDSIGLTGYEFEISGGSDLSGVPMRSDNPGNSRKRVLTVSNTVGFRKGRDGMKKRKLVAGNTITENTSQINATVVKSGKESLFAEPEPEASAEKEPEATASTEKSTEKASETPKEEAEPAKEVSKEE